MKLIKTFFFLVICLNIVTAQSLTNIAVLDLEGKNVPQTEASILTDKLRGELYNTGQFQIIERSRMNEILEEQGFQQTGCVSDECIVEVGKLIGVEQIVAGSIGKVGEIYLISIRLIDISEGRIIKNVEEMIEGSISDVLKTGIGNVAGKLVGREEIEAPELPELGTLSITSVPSSALISIDGASIPQKTPAVIKEMTAGRHIVVISFPGYRDFQKNVNITVGKTTTLDVQLRQIPQPKLTEELEQLKYSFKIKFSSIAEAMREYDDWSSEYNRFIIAADTARYGGKKLGHFGTFGNLTSFEIQFVYSFSPKYEIGLTVGRMGGEQQYSVRSPNRTTGWAHKFAISNIFESVIFYYNLIPAPSRFYTTLGIGLDIYQSTIDFTNNFDLGKNEDKSTLTTSGIGFQTGLGIGYNFTSRLGFELNVDWHSATLKGYSGKIKNYSYGNLQSEDDAILFTQFLYYGAAPESSLGGVLTSKEGTVDLTGVQVSAGLVFSF